MRLLLLSNRAGLGVTSERRPIDVTQKREREKKKAVLCREREQRREGEGRDPPPE